MILLKSERFYTCPGSKYRITYDYIPNNNSGSCFRESGKVDIQEEINSFADMCDMSLIVRQMMAGDMSAFRKVEPFYGDFSQIPNEFEVQEILKGVQDHFEASEELVKKYGSFFDYVNALFGNGDDLDKSEPDKHENNLGE